MDVSAKTTIVISTKQAKLTEIDYVLKQILTFTVKYYNTVCGEADSQAAKAQDFIVEWECCCYFAPSLPMNLLCSNGTRMVHPQGPKREGLDNDVIVKFRDQNLF